MDIFFDIFVWNSKLAKSLLKLAKMQEIQLNFNTKNFRLKFEKLCIVSLIPKGQKLHYAIFPGKYFVNDDLP